MYLTKSYIFLNFYLKRVKINNYNMPCMYINLSYIFNFINNYTNMLILNFQIVELKTFTFIKQY